MAGKQQRISVQYLRNLVPISQLTQDNLQELSDSMYVEELPAGRFLFKKGEKDNRSYYLLAGEVELDYGDGDTKTVIERTSQVRFPLDHHQPRQASARTKTPIKYIWVDNNHLDVLLTWDQSAGYMVSEIEDAGDSSGANNDWMSNILRSKIFHQMPPTNIQNLLVKMSEVQAKSGERIIRQGDEGDYYYYINKGRALVTHTSSRSGKELKLAELGPGSSFGEEALISGAKRNANVTMITDGMLIRLAKTDFEELLKAPVLKSVSFEQAKKMFQEGAIWLDVRLETEHKNFSIPQSVNIPLYLLRNKVAELDKSKQYIVYCDTGSRSSSAAYLLSERGFEAYVLAGGLMGLKKKHTTAS